MVRHLYEIREVPALGAVVVHDTTYGKAIAEFYTTSNTLATARRNAEIFIAAKQADMQPPEAPDAHTM